MLILLFGRIGQLGWELRRTLAPLGRVTALDFPEIDLADPDQVCRPIRDVRPQIIINATAYTAVDRAESEPEIALAINGRAPGIMAEEARAIGAALIHYSTDYVFDGLKGSPYLETDRPNPANAYGHSKLAGEEFVQQVGGAALILRTSWVYSLRGDSFVTKVLNWSRRSRTLRMVTDQVSNPTWARMLAEISADLLALKAGDSGQHIVAWLGEHRGIYHLAGEGYASRLEWAQAILSYDPHPEEQTIQELLPALTSDFPAPAQRPLFSALNCNRFTEAFGLRLPAWKTALQLAMEAN